MKYSNTPHSFSMDKDRFQDFQADCKSKGLNVSIVIRDLIKEYMIGTLRAAHELGEAMAGEK
jgi:hypothetical protein